MSQGKTFYQELRRLLAWIPDGAKEVEISTKEITVAGKNVRVFVTRFSY